MLVISELGDADLFITLQKSNNEESMTESILA
jgi:hypothetical protein